MEIKNATFLFEKPIRKFHNPERYWAAYFGLFLLSASEARAPSALPVYSCDRDGRVTQDRSLDGSGLTFTNLIVDGMLSGEPFGLREWPEEILNLQIDVVLQRSDQKRVDFIEVKTIGASVRRNFMPYARVCEVLRLAGWTTNLYYLLSHGHEVRADFALLASQKFGIILWEDVFKFAAQMPVGRLLSGVDLISYTAPPEP